MGNRERERKGWGGGGGGEEIQRVNLLDSIGKEGKDQEVVLYFFFLFFFSYTDPRIIY